MRWWQATLMLVVAAAVGLATGSRPFLVAGLALVLLLVVGVWYRRLLVAEVIGRRLTSTPVVNWGDMFVHTILFENRSHLLIPAVRVLDETSLPEHDHGYVASIPPRSTVTWELPGVPCTERGRYQVGPTVAHMTDPMGLFVVERLIAGKTSVLVLPRWVHLRRSALALDGFMPGEARGRRRGESPPAVTGLRDYVAGDSLAAIHWPASVRAGHLMTKLFDPEVQTTLWLALDLDATLGKPREELLVTAATSLGMYALRRAGLRVGVFVGGSVRVGLVAERGHRQQVQLLEYLAEVRSGDAVELSAVLRQYDRWIGPGHVVVLFTDRGPDVWGSWLQHFMRRGIAPRVVSAHDGARGWDVPYVALPETLADPDHAQELVRALEGGRVESV